LQHAEFHSSEYSACYSKMLIKKVSHNPIGISNLDRTVRSLVAARPEHWKCVLRALPSPYGRTARPKEAADLDKASLWQAHGH
jgi:hypothetical protein